LKLNHRVRTTYEVLSCTSPHARCCTVWLHLC